MRKFAAALTIVLLTTAAAHAGDADAVLAANKAAMGHWAGKATLTLNYGYAGQGLTGTTSSIDDVRNGRYIDSSDIPPDAQASGYDGVHVWLREPSGTVTEEAGGDMPQIAANEAWRVRNGWWSKGHDGAKIVSGGRQSDIAGTFDVLTITPKGGRAFDAWFDSRTHLLFRTIEKQGTLTITTSFQDYAPFDGAVIARKQIVDDGSGAANAQTMTLTSAVFSPGRPRAAFAQPKADLHDFSIAGGAHSATVPFQLLNNHIYADVSINGAAPLPFIFDTGGHNILTPETSKNLHVKSAGTTTSAGGGDAVVTGGEARVDSIRVGDATITNQPVSVLQFDAPGVEGIHEGGMVGYEFFARFVMQVDYGKRTLTFFDKRTFAPKDAGTPVAMALYGQFPEVRGSYDGIPARFGIDTGARSALLLTRPFAEQNNLRAKAPGGVEAMTGWGVGGPSRSYVTRGGALTVGPIAIDHPLTILSVDKGGAGGSENFPNNIGGGILKRYVVTIDYDHNLLYLKPVTGPVADLDTFDRAGLWINESDDGFKIIDITRTGPAEAAGLQKDDIITAVDGVPAAQIHLYDLRARLRNDPPGTKVTFTLKGGHSVPITLRDLI